MIYLLVFLMSAVSLDTETSVKKLNPNINAKNLETVSTIVNNRAKLYGFAQSDYPLILSMIKKESNFSHIYGKHGEVGMLQVIPEDSHVLTIISKISCEKTDKYCGGDGLPDVYTGSKLNSFKARRFISEHPKYALETGFGEMQYWKLQYENRLKQKYWTKFPEWYLKNNLDNYNERVNNLKWWWTNLTTKAGDLVWISHYNWGNRMSTALSSRNYALQVLNFKAQLEEL